MKNDIARETVDNTMLACCLEEPKETREQV